MKHRVGFNRLGRKPAHRKALHRNMVTSLFKHERIRTTKAKAREIRRTAEKMITRAKVDSVHNRRMVGRDIKDEGILAKLFVDIAPRYKSRPGGYTRMLKIGPRRGDASEMVLLELVEEELPGRAAGEKSEKSGRKRGAGSRSKQKQAAAAKETEQNAPEAPANDDRPEAEASGEAAAVAGDTAVEDAGSEDDGQANASGDEESASEEASPEADEAAESDEK